MVSLPVTMLWTALGGYAAWHDFDIGHTVIVTLAITSLYLMFAGIAQQIIPASIRSSETL
jgi:phosphatidylcholine synthase